MAGLALRDQCLNILSDAVGGFALELDAVAQVEELG